MNRLIRFVMLGALVVATPGMLLAQDGGRRQQGQGQGRQRPQMPAEQQIGVMLKEFLQLTDQQVVRFREVNGRYQTRRQALNDEERQARMSMRDMLCNGDTTRGAELSRALDQTIEVQKRRVQLLEEEQREFSTFLTPYQRARVIGFSERVADAFGARGRGGRVGAPRGGAGAPPPEGQRNRPPQDGARGGMPDVCSMPIPPEGGRGMRGRGGRGG
jgi:hypothetical protein